MPPVGLEPTISAGERPQTYALDRAATGTGKTTYIEHENEEIGAIFETRNSTSVCKRSGG